MNNPLQDLLKLQSLEFADVIDTNAQAAISGLRQKIPLLVLKNYDRLTDRGKKGIAVVRHSVCTGCYMHIPIGAVIKLMAGGDCQMCENCGRYLYLPVDEQKALREASVEPAAPPPLAIPKRKAGRPAGNKVSRARLHYALSNT